MCFSDCVDDRRAEPSGTVVVSSKMKSAKVRFCGGEQGIRTPGTLRYNGFQDRRIRPLCQLSVCDDTMLIFLDQLPI